MTALGDLERRAGHAQAALAAYGRAVQAASKDARGWRGIGTVEGERENFRRARTNLERAITLDASDAAALGELASVEGVTGDFEGARANLGRALAQQPDNYVALTSLGIVELRAGRPRPRSRRCCRQASSSRAMRARTSTSPRRITSWAASRPRWKS